MGCMALSLLKGFYIYHLEAAFTSISHAMSEFINPTVKRSQDRGKAEIKVYLKLYWTVIK